jgi:hypothetical protein
VLASDGRLPAEEAATADGKSMQDIVTHGIGFACGIIYAMSIVITAGQCNSNATAFLSPLCLHITLPNI